MENSEPQSQGSAAEQKCHAITAFQGEHRWLSNFWPLRVPIMIEGQKYPSSEHAYQAMKTLDKNDRAKIAVMRPGEAKRAGRKVIKRDDWEQVKVAVMEEIVFGKFDRNTELRDKLLATGDAELIEGNHWGDRFWGVCNGVGENNLGKVLMRVRQTLRARSVGRATEEQGAAPIIPKSALPASTQGASEKDCAELCQTIWAAIPESFKTDKAQRATFFMAFRMGWNEKPPVAAPLLSEEETERFPKGGVTGRSDDTRSLYEQMLWELENASAILKTDGYNYSHGRIQVLLAKAKSSAHKAGGEVTADLELPEAVEDRVEHVLQKALAALLVRWMQRSAGYLTIQCLSVADAINECMHDLEKLLSSHSNAALPLPVKKKILEE